MVKTCQIVYLFCNFFVSFFFFNINFFSTTSSHRVWICFSHSLLAIESKLLELLCLNHGQNTYWKNIEIPFFVSSCMLLDDSHLNLNYSLHFDCQHCLKDHALRTSYMAGAHNSFCTFSRKLTHVTQPCTDETLIVSSWASWSSSVSSLCEDDSLYL